MADPSTPTPPAGAHQAREHLAGEHLAREHLAREHLARPPAVRLDARTVVLTGTGLWFAAFVVLLPFWGWLGRHDHRVWLWTCLAGGVLGLVGYALMAKHRREGRTG